MYDSEKGGNDILTSTNSGYFESFSFLYGDVWEHIYDSAQGGNDILTVTNSGWQSHALLFGDAINIYDSAQGGSDMSYAQKLVTE